MVAKMSSTTTLFLFIIVLITVVLIPNNFFPLSKISSPDRTCGYIPKADMKTTNKR